MAKMKRTILKAIAMPLVLSVLVLILGMFVLTGHVHNTSAPSGQMAMASSTYDDMQPASGE